MACWLLVLLEAMFISAPAPCSAGPPPDFTISTRGSIAPALAIARLLSGCAARFMSAPAASSWREALPFESKVTSGLMAPACSMATWFSGCWQARFQMAKQACSFAGELPLRSSSTSGGRAPAATIAAWLVGFWMARLPRIPAAVSWTAAVDLLSKLTTAGMAPAIVIFFWCSMQSAKLMMARAAWSCTSPSFRSMSSRGCRPPAPTTRWLSAGPVAACAASAAAERVCACAVPFVRSSTISSSDSEPLNSSFCGVGGGLGLGLGGAAAALGAEGGGVGATAAAATKPPMATRCLAAARTASDIGTLDLVESSDSRSTAPSAPPSIRGVTSTQTPLGFSFHHRLCPTKAVPPDALSS
mmetsp:Transcript_53478/g.106399  ORF Transcript_53478/g.106399 Transcript_53478/m.106399 type:complete len:357 (-) Transcript_53478:386-1456(-)